MADIIWCGLRVYADYCWRLWRFVVVCSVEVAAEGFREGFGKVAYAANVDGNEVLFRGTGKGKRMVLEERDFRAAEEDVLFMAISCRLMLVLGGNIPGPASSLCVPF